MGVYTCMWFIAAYLLYVLLCLLCRLPGARETELTLPALTQLS